MNDGRATLVCRVGARRLGLPVAAVARVLPLRPLWRPPTLPRPIAGFVAERNRAVPVLALAALFDDYMPATLDLYAHLVRLRGGGAGDALLLVDRVEAFVAAGEVHPVAPDTSLNGVVTGEFATPDGIVHLLDPARLLLAGEAARLAALTADAQTRLAQWAAAS